MMRRTALAVALLLAGCAMNGGGSASPPSAESWCERQGGVWRPAAAVCEFPSSGGGGGM